MAVFRNVMAFLGLDDDDQVYDDEAYYDDEDPEVSAPVASRNSTRTISIEERLADPEPSFGFSADSAVNEMGGVGAVRPLRPVPAETPDVPPALAGADRRINLPDTAGAFEAPPMPIDEAARVPPVAETGQQVGAVPAPGEASRPSLTAIDGNGGDPAAQSKTRNNVEEPKSDVVTYAKPRLHIPSSFDDASRIADDFRIGSPVVMNLTKVEKPVARRLIDFASGVCYVLDGGMERVAPNVYLLTPSGIDVSADDRRRMQERGYDR